MKNLKLVVFVVISLFSLISCIKDDDIISEVKKESKISMDKMGKAKPVKYYKHKLIYDTEDHVYNLNNQGWVISDERSDLYFYNTVDELHLKSIYNIHGLYIYSPAPNSDFGIRRIDDNHIAIRYIGDLWYGQEFLNGYTLYCTLIYSR